MDKVSWNVTQENDIRYIAEIISEEYLEGEKPFIVYEWISATKGLYRSQCYTGGVRDSENDAPYWLICGDNMGSQQLIVYPYQIEALVDLLGALAGKKFVSTEEVEKLKEENRYLIAEQAAVQKANIASRRSLCEQSDKYKERAETAEAALADALTAKIPCDTLPTSFAPLEEKND